MGNGIYWLDFEGDGYDDITDYYGIAPDMGAYENLECYVQLGDVNGNGLINILDIVQTSYYILGISAPNFECAADFNNEFGYLIPKGDYETIGGYIISELGRIPNKGEHLFMNVGHIVIVNASARQVHQVKIYPQN